MSTIGLGSLKTDRNELLKEGVIRRLFDTTTKATPRITRNLSKRKRRATTPTRPADCRTWVGYQGC